MLRLIIVAFITYSIITPLFASNDDVSFQSESSYSIKSFRSAKKYLMDVYKDNKKTFYCHCEFTADKNIHADNCGYSARKNVKRGARLEWEHIVPASRFGKPLQCWRQPESFTRCIKKNGKTLSGRKCCRKVNPTFRAMEADMINLVPAVGELNGDRSNYKFAVLEGEERVYGSCDFEVNHSAKHVEPARSIQGDIARIYFYMQKKYDLALTPEEITLFQSWAKNDPITEWEQQKHRQINNLLTALEKNELKNKQFAADE